MTNEQNFKKGDKVRYIGNYPCYVRTDISKDETYTVREINGDMCLVDVPSEGAICVNDLELVEPYDRRTDFLRKLGALLREFDARIGYFIGDDEKYGWSDYPFLKVGKETIKYPAGEIDEINAANIMDYVKE